MMNFSFCAAVAEDEPYNLKRLSRLLQEQGCEVVAELANGLEVMKWVEAGGTADVLFLDIQMPGLSGIDITALLDGKMPIVYVTAFPQHAVIAFEQNALDYLLKPVSADRLARALERVPSAKPLPSPSKLRNSFRYPVKVGGGLVFVGLNQTTHFEYVDNTVWAYSGERLRTTWKSLGDAEVAMEGLGLLKVHRNIMIRPEAIVGIRHIESGRLIVRLTGGVEVIASRGASPGIKNWLGLA